MRVTNQMVVNNMLTNINRNLTSLNKYNTQGSTGKKIQMPSEDPIIASRALKFRTIVSENEQYLKNLDQANSWLEVTEASAQNINSIATKMKELCQQGASDTYTVEDRQKLATEFASLLEQLEQELNTTYMGRYIYSGYKTDTPPITQDANGNNILNQEIYGEDLTGQNITLQVGTGSSITVNSFVTSIYSEEDFNNFHSFVDFALSAAEDDDSELREKMASMITTIDNYTSKVAVEHTEIGVKIKRAELIETRLKNDQTNYTELMSNNEDADIAEVMMNLTNYKAIYQASLQIAMNVTQISLADYLR